LVRLDGNGHLFRFLAGLVRKTRLFLRLILAASSLTGVCGIQASGWWLSSERNTQAGPNRQGLPDQFDGIDRRSSSDVERIIPMLWVSPIARQRWTLYVVILSFSHSK
jgi:hypothetical protein